MFHAKRHVISTEMHYWHYVGVRRLKLGHPSIFREHSHCVHNMERIEPVRCAYSWCSWSPNPIECKFTLRARVCMCVCTNKLGYFYTLHFVWAAEQSEPFFHWFTMATHATQALWTHSFTLNNVASSQLNNNVLCSQHTPSNPTIQLPPTSFSRSTTVIVAHTETDYYHEVVCSFRTHHVRKRNALACDVLRKVRVFTSESVSTAQCIRRCRCSTGIGLVSVCTDGSSSYSVIRASVLWYSSMWFVVCVAQCLFQLIVLLSAILGSLELTNVARPYNSELRNLSQNIVTFYPIQQCIIETIGRSECILKNMEK